MGLLDVEQLLTAANWTLAGDWSLQWLHVYPLHNAAAALGWADQAVL